MTISTCVHIVNDYVNTEQSVNVVVDYADTTMTSWPSMANFGGLKRVRMMVTTRV